MRRFALKHELFTAENPRMEFVSGWYPDPAGTAQLRFWDGQSWTTATASPPAQQQYPPEAAMAPIAEPARATFANILAHRPPRRREINFYALLAALAAVFVIAAIAIPLALSNGKNAAATDTASGSGLKPGSIHLPTSFGGFNRITGAQAAGFEQGVAQTWPLSTQRVVGLYGIASEPRIGVIAGSLPLSASGISSFVTGMEEGAARSAPSLEFEPEDAGPYGGELVCATSPTSASIPTPTSICLFADLKNVGVTFASGPASSSLQQAIELRSEIEAPPAT